VAETGILIMKALENSFPMSSSLVDMYFAVVSAFNR
jgi:hypothetical protein